MMKETSSSRSKILALAYLQTIFPEFLRDSTDVTRVDLSLASGWVSVWRGPSPEPTVGTSWLRVASTMGACLPSPFQPPNLQRQAASRQFNSKYFSGLSSLVAQIKTKSS